MKMNYSTALNNLCVFYNVLCGFFGSGNMTKSRVQNNEHQVFASKI